MMETYRTIWCLLLSFLSSFALYAQNEASTGYSKGSYELTSREIKILDEIIPEFDPIGPLYQNSMEINVLFDSLQAIIGSSEQCMGDAAIVPLMMDKFQSVTEFQLKLSYNADSLYCEGYLNVNTLLANNLTGMIDMINGVIVLNWHGDIPVTFHQLEKVIDLIFIPKTAGLWQLQWLTGATESYFNNSDGNPIPAGFHNGEVIIYEPPIILLSDSKTVCEGETVTITAVASSMHPPISYQWTYPDGTITSSDPFFASVTQADSGDYKLRATDALGCTDQKSIHLGVTYQAIIENNTTRIVIYPNPGSGLFGVRISVSEDVIAAVKVTDAAGTVVYQKADVGSPAAGQININLSNFTDGLYFLIVSIKDSVLQEKLILRHN
jgi:hypothetical protein